MLLRKAGAVLFPWPGRDERLASIQCAQREKQRSRDGAARAAVLERQIHRLAEENHFAMAITDQIIARHRRTN
jgi:hypothetical protein